MLPLKDLVEYLSVHMSKETIKDGGVGGHPKGLKTKNSAILTSQTRETTSWHIEWRTQKGRTSEVGKK